MQLERFKQAANELGTNDDTEWFKKTPRKLAMAPSTWQTEEIRRAKLDLGHLDGPPGV